MSPTRKQGHVTRSDDYGLTPPDALKMLTLCRGMNTVRTDDPIIARWFAYLRASGHSHNTLLAYRTGLRDLATFTRRPLLGLVPDDLEAWANSATSRVGSSTIRSYITGIRAFYAWALRREYITADPTRLIDPPRAPRRLPRPLSDDNIDLAIEAARHDPDVAAAIALGRLAGLRCCEIAALDWAEVQLGADAHLRVVQGKGCHERVVDIAPRLELVLSALPHRSGPVVRRRDGLRTNNQPWRISQLINQHLDVCEIDGTAHQLRHSFGTAFYLATKDIRRTAEVMGHSAITTSAIYSRVSRGDVRQGVMDAADLRVS